MSLSQQDISRLGSYFLSKDGGILQGEVTPGVDLTYNLGRSDKRWETIYVGTLIADNIQSGGGMGDADTVDGFDAAQNPLASTLLALDPQGVFPTGVYNEALLKDGSRALEGNLTVVAGATIDGVDIGTHSHTGVGDQGTQLSHATLTGLDADDHLQYAERAQDETITGDWMFTHLVDRSAGWQFLPDDKVFQAVPHNLVLKANETEASIGIGPIVSTEYAIFLFDDTTPTTYIKVGRGNDSLILSGTDATYRFWAGHADGASAPFSVEKDGSLFATAGEIAGWTIDNNSISKNDMVLHSDGYVAAGTGDDLVRIDSQDATWRLWAGNAVAANAPFRVNKTGDLYIGSGYVSGVLRSTNFISGQTGFGLNSSGLAEFDNIIARGRLQATVFAEATISVASGKLIISDGAVIATDVDSADDFIIVDAAVFLQNDIVRLKPDVSRDEWMRITSPFIAVGDAYKYFVVRSLNSAEGGWAGPYDFYAGESVVRMGSAEELNVVHPFASGEVGGEYGELQPGGSGSTTGGGFLILEGSRQFGPYFGVAARFGPVYDQLLDVVRIGNLDGVLDYTSEEWGAFFGDANAFMTYDQTQGLRIEFSGTGVDTTIDDTGISTETVSIAKVTAPGDSTDPYGFLYHDTSNNKLYWKYIGTTYDLTAGASGAPVDESYVVMALSGSLTDERRLQGTAGQVVLADGGAGGDATLSLPSDINLTGASTIGTTSSTLTLDPIGNLILNPGGLLTLSKGLSANWDAGGFEIRSATFESDIVTGTAPLVIASTTKVANLNVDSLDDQSGAYYLDSTNFTGTDWTDLTDAGPTTLHKHDHGNLDGLGDNDHSQYILHSLADAVNDFLVASGANTYVKKTLAQTGAILEGDIDHGNIQGLSTGADHSYIDQDVKAAASPTFVKVNTTEIEYGGNITIDANKFDTDSTVTIMNSNASYKASLDVESHITLGGSVDGVDVANFNVAQFVVLAASTYMANERVLTAGEGIDLADGGAGSTITINAEWATTTNKGVASFATADFTVSSGAVSIKESGVDHGGLGGLGDDDHGAVYPAFASIETISGAWTFDTAAPTFDIQQKIKGIAAPGAGAAGYGNLYAKTDGGIYFHYNGGSEVDLTAGATTLPHVLATSGPHTGTLPFVDLAVGSRGSIIRRGAADWEEYILGTLNYVLKSGATDVAWGQVAFSELSGDIVYTQLDSIVDTSGGGSANMISSALHVHTGADGSNKVTYSNLLSIPSTFAPSAHALSGGDHTGDLAYTQLDSLVDTSGGGSANLISGAQHQHTDADGSTKVGHGNLSGVSIDQHHARNHDIEGSTHTASGLTIGEVLRATGATTFAFQALIAADIPQLDHGGLSGLGDDDHGAVYPNFGATETITGNWKFTTNDVQFDLQLELKGITAPGAGAAGYGHLYAKTDGKVYFHYAGGAELDLTAGGAHDHDSDYLQVDGSNRMLEKLVIYDAAATLAEEEIFALAWRGKDSIGNEQEYATIHGYIVDPENGSETGGLNFKLAAGGTARKAMSLKLTTMTLWDFAAGAQNITTGTLTSGSPALELDPLGDLIFDPGSGVAQFQFTLSGDWDAGGYEIRARTFESDVATGTKPFTVASTTLVNNLNADRLDSLEATDFIKKDGSVALTQSWDAGGFEIRSKYFESDAPTGAPPFTIASTTVVPNLNVDLLDGEHASAFANASHSHDHGGLSGLGDNDHSQYILHSLADATNDFLVASGANVYVKKTLAQTGAILEGDIDHGNIQGLSTGADHSYIDQDVTVSGSPTFAGLNVDGQLQIVGEDTYDLLEIYGYRSGSNPYPGITLYSARGTEASPTDILSGDSLINIGGRGYVNGGWSTTKVWIYGAAAENWSAGNTGSYLAFHVTPIGSDIRAEAMRLTSDGLVQDAWTAISSFANSWVNFGGDYNPAGYFKDIMGIVHLRGFIKDGTIGQTAFTLPAGYRPENFEVMPTASNGAFGEVFISTNGDVKPLVGDNTWFSIDGVTFRAV